MAYRYLLVMRFALVNVIAIGLVGAAYLQGWLAGLFVSHTLVLTGAIFLVFLYGLVLCGVKVWRTSIELNDVKTGSPDPDSRAGRYFRSVETNYAESRTVRVGMLRLRLSHRIVIVRHIASSLVFLGLIGTVIGFIIALSGVDAKAITEVENVAPMVSTLINGMSIALYTTLLGAVLNIWLTVNHRILATGTVALITSIIELGESHGRA
jgi:hypothetical protein